MGIRCSACDQENRQGSTYCMQCGALLDVDPSADALIGRVLMGRYRVLSVLDEGGMGRVYLAEQQLGTATRKVAIKVLHAPHSRDETLRRRFYGECEVVVQLTHPNTIQFYDFGELDDGRLFIVMEHIEGHSLARALHAGAMPLARVERLLAQIAGSLSEAHAHGIIHRDLKPDNILLTTRGGEHDFVKVCDFGIAKRADEAEVAQLTLQGTVIGTPQYMSPEQLTGGELDARSDIYSLGLILFEMLTGERPFSARSPAEWAAKHTSAEPPPLESFPATRDLPDDKKQAVMRALGKLPHERPATARQLAAEFVGRGDATTPVTMSTESREVPVVTPAMTPRSTVDVTAPTIQASPAALRKKDVDPVLAPAGRRRGMLGIALGSVGIALAIAAALIATDPGATPVSTGADGGAGVRAIDAGPPDSGPEQIRPREWIRIVQLQRQVSDAALALGPPDGQYAIVRHGGTLTLELAAGTRIATDGTPGPDLAIEIDDARSGPYRADVGVDRHQYTTVGSELVGSLPLDADQYGIRRIRYVRIKNRGRRDLYVDAVGAYQTVSIGAGAP